MKGITRRGFVRIAGSVVAGVAGGTFTLLEPKMLWAAQAPAPSDTVQFGIIGAGTQGSDLLRNALKVPGAECVAVSDLYDTRLEHAKTILKKNVDTAKDYRRILDRKDINAVIVATPDHWHRRLVVEAAQAGKDVYCEKPMSHSAEDGFAMVEAVKKNNRICQIGSQRVSSIMYAKAKEIWDSGRLGQVDTIEAVWDRNSDSGAWMFPIPPDANEKTIDWNTWLGDAPKRPFDGRRFVSWRCYKDYGTGLPGDLFVHLISGIQLHHGSERASGSRVLYGRNLPLQRARLWRSAVDDLRLPEIPGDSALQPEQSLRRPAIRILRKKGNDVYPRSGCAPGIGRGRITLVRSRAAVSRRPKGIRLVRGRKRRKKSTWRNGSASILGLAVGQAKLESGEEVYVAPPGYSDLVDHLANFFQAVRTRKPVVENEGFGNVAALTGCHMSNHSYFNKTIAVWDEGSNKIKSA